MDGTHLAIAGDTLDNRGALVPDGPDALSRIISFGHALRTISEYLSDHFFEGAPEPTLAMMHDAYDRLADRRPGFTPEEFTLLVMSTLLGRCTDPEEQARFRRGAAAYILRAAPKLPDEYAPIIEDARRMTLRKGQATQGTQILQERVAPSSGVQMDASPKPAAPASIGTSRAPFPEPAPRAPTVPSANPYARDRETLRRQPALVSDRRGGSGFALTVLVIATIAAIIIVMSSQGWVSTAAHLLPGATFN